MKILSCFSKTSNEKKFWKWFCKNSLRIFSFEKQAEKIFDEIQSHLHKINSDLTFEISSIKEGRRDFIISADGILSAFSAVEKLYSEKPALKEWNIIKFRPRRKIENSIKIGEKELLPADIKFMFIKDENHEKAGIVLFCKGFNKNEENVYNSIAFLYLDESLGEYDVETFIGTITVQGFDSEYFDNSVSIEKLAEEFDKIKLCLKN